MADLKPQAACARTQTSIPNGDRCTVPDKVPGRALGNLQRLSAIVIVAVLISGCALFRPPPISWNDTKWCVPARLKTVLRQVARNYGEVRVHSTHRWPLENKRKGGKPKSYHLTCKAVDFSVAGDPPGVLEFLKNHRKVGGYARYPQGFYHIDTGPKRTW